MFNRKLKEEIAELKRKVAFMLPKKCRKDDHEMVPITEAVYNDPMDPADIHGTTTTTLQCKNCGFRVNKYSH